MLYFRCDMNEKIATGHVMRCLSIADVAKGLGVDSAFICADEGPAEYIRQRSYQCFVLHSDSEKLEEELPKLEELLCSRDSIGNERTIDQWNHEVLCLEPNEENHSGETAHSGQKAYRGQKSYREQNAYHGPKSNVLLVDSYAATGKYLTELEKVARVFYIDDMGVLDYSIAGVICYGSQYHKIGLDADALEGRKHHVQAAVRLLGPVYTPLRREFSNCRRKVVREQVQAVLIMSGGSDPYNVVGGVLDALRERRLLQQYHDVWAICGRFNARHDELVESYKDFKHVHILRSTSDIMSYMEQADVAISAGGTTVLELCAVGTPTIVYTFADNQVEGTKAMCESGMMLYAGDARENAALADNIVNLMTEPAAELCWRQQASTWMQQTVDGRGAERIAKELIRWDSE